MSNDPLRDRLNQEVPPVETGAMPIVSNAMFAMKVREMRGVIEKYPSHSLSAHFTKAIAGLAADSEITIEKMDLEAIFENRLVEVEITIGEEGREVHKKKLGAHLPKIAAASPSASPKKPEAPGPSL